MLPRSQMEVSPWRSPTFVKQLGVRKGSMQRHTQSGSVFGELIFFPPKNKSGSATAVRPGEKAATRVGKSANVWRGTLPLPFKWQTQSQWQLLNVKLTGEEKSWHIKKKVNWQTKLLENFSAREVEFYIFKGRLNEWISLSLSQYSDQADNSVLSHPKNCLPFNLLLIITRIKHVPFRRD